MRKLFIFLFFLSGAAAAQKLPDDGFDKVRIATPEKTIQAELKAVETDPSIEQGRFYYWYSANIIHATQGGFSGRLLNGLYSEYFLNKNLKEQGIFKKGLKDGVWRNWTDNGFIAGSVSWKNGIKSGPFNVYDEHGLKQSGNYRDDLLEGKVKTYKSGGSITVTYYHNGVMTANGHAPSIWARLHIFKKKDKAPQVSPVSPKKV